MSAKEDDAWRRGRSQLLDVGLLPAWGHNQVRPVRAPDLGVEPGTDVTMGIRPEDVYLVDEESLVSNPSHRIDAVTDVLEPMGDEIFVYLKLSESAETDLEDTSGVANDQLLMSVAPDTDIAEDEDVTVVLDRSRVHLFDTATGEAISHGIETPVQTSGAPGTEAESDD